MWEGTAGLSHSSMSHTHTHTHTSHPPAPCSRCCTQRGEGSDARGSRLMLRPNDSPLVTTTTLLWPVLNFTDFFIREPCSLLSQGYMKQAKKPNTPLVWTNKQKANNEQASNPPPVSVRLIPTEPKRVRTARDATDATDHAGAHIESRCFRVNELKGHFLLLSP